MFEDTKGVIRIRKSKNRQWPNEKVQKDKQRPTKYTHNTKDRVTWTSLKTRSELRCFGRISSSCSTSDTRYANLVTNPVIGHEWGKDRKLSTRWVNEWLVVNAKWANWQLHHGEDKLHCDEMMSSLYLTNTLCWIVSASSLNNCPRVDIPS